MTKIVIVGATSAIATEVARQYAVNNMPEFVLIGRNQKLLDTLRKDLIVRGANAKSRVIVTALDQAEHVVPAVNSAFEGGRPNIVLIAQGSLPDQLECESEPSIASNEITLNAISPVMWAEAFSHSMGVAGPGVIAVIGSVAGDRGRKSNYVYGAAKALVDTYVRGMQHRLYRSNLKMLLIKPGPVDTPMTAQLKGSVPGMASTTDVAKDIRKAIEHKKSVLYTPGKWAVIMFVIRNIPASIFNRLNL